MKQGTGMTGVYRVAGVGGGDRDVLQMPVASAP